LSFINNPYRRLGGGFLYNFSFRVNITRNPHVMSQLDPIKELYDMYLEEEKPPRIVKVTADDWDFNLDNEDRLADPYLEL